MEASTARRFWITVVIGAIAVAVVVVGFNVVGTDPPEQRAFNKEALYAGIDRSQLVELDCPDDDLIYNVQFQVSPKGLEDTAREALAEQVTEAYPGLRPREFEVTGETDDGTEYSAEVADETLAQVELMETPTGWTVDRFSACNSFLKKQRG